MATANWWQGLDQQPPAGFGYPSWLGQYDQQPMDDAFAQFQQMLGGPDAFAQFQRAKAGAQQMTDPLDPNGQKMPDAFKPPLIGESLQPGVPNQVIPSGGAQTATTGATGGGAPRVGTSGASAAPSGGYSTAGRTGATYDTFLAANPGFDPWTNLDQYAGAGAGNDPILAQAFGWTNEWARHNGYSDGSNIPLAQRQRIFLANVERARQQWSDNANDPGARRNITWEQSAASRIPNQGWSYTGPYTAGANPAPQAPQAAAPAAQQQTGGNTVSGLTGSGGGSGGSGPLPQALGGGTNQGTSHQGGPFGAIPDFDPTYAFQAAANSPSVAAGYIRAQKGQTGRSLSRMSQFRDNLYGKALQAYLALAGLGGNAGGGQGITDFISTLNGGGGGGSIMDLINRQAGTVAGQGFGGMDDATIEEALRAATALSSLNLGSVAGSGLSDQLDSLLYDQQMKGILSSGNDQSNLGAQFGGSPYQRALAAYTGMQGR